MSLFAVVGSAVLMLGIAGVLYQLFGSARSARRFRHPGNSLTLAAIGFTRCTPFRHPHRGSQSGIAASSLSWTRVAPEVARFTSVCAYRPRGTGVERAIERSAHDRSYRR